MPTINAKKVAIVYKTIQNNDFLVGIHLVKDTMLLKFESKLTCQKRQKSNMTCKEYNKTVLKSNMTLENTGQSQ